MSAVNDAALAAQAAFERHRTWPAAGRAAFLERIATEIESLGDELLQVCHAESALPLARLTGERARTCGQLRLFAQLVKEGSWVDARIDTALPDRKPLPRPDLRRMLVPLGPVAVFGASNFPLAFSVAGGDTASAFAAGCPVVVKEHPAHPRTSRLVAGAIRKAADACGLAPGVFALVAGGAEESVALVRHPAICAVGFTGSERAGRALFDAAATRPRPIPVFSEMSSINPLVILPGAVAERSPALAEGLASSATLGVGQFCTKPGLALVVDGPQSDAFLAALETKFGAATGGKMLTAGIREKFEAERKSALTALDRSAPHGAVTDEAKPSVAVTTAMTFLANPALAREVFGPFCLVVRGSEPELLACLDTLDGQLTGTLQLAAADSEIAPRWIAKLQAIAGRVIVNGFPTGVEVSPAMHHGGPYPATTDARFTSVGTAAILRFARPVCFQNLPTALLPPELQDANVGGLLRLINGVATRDSIAG